MIPSLRGWYADYKEQGLVVIGNHYPEFDYEADIENLKEAIKRLEITYPVAQDKQGDTWNAYATRYWPTLYLIDKWGNLRFVHIGEGKYEEIEENIEVLLDESYP